MRASSNLVTINTDSLAAFVRSQAAMNAQQQPAPVLLPSSPSKSIPQDILTGLIDVVQSMRAAHGWSVQQGRELVSTLWRALVAKACNAAPMTCSLPPTLDAVWHAFLLETELYARFCKEVCGGIFLHHTARTANDALADKQARVTAMLAMYKSCWPDAKDMHEWCWKREGAEEEEEEEERVVSKGSRKRSAPPAPVVLPDGRRTPWELDIKTQTGKTIKLWTAVGFTAATIKSLVQFRDGIPCDQQRLVFAGCQLEDNDPIINQRIIHLVLRLRGC